LLQTTLGPSLRWDDGSSATVIPMKIGIQRR